MPLFRRKTEHTFWALQRLPATATRRRRGSRRWLGGVSGHNESSNTKYEDMVGYDQHRRQGDVVGGHDFYKRPTKFGVDLTTTEFKKQA